MALDIIGALADLGTALMAAKNYKKGEPTPTFSIVGTGVLFSVLGILATVMTVNVAPTWSPLATVLVSLASAFLLLSVAHALGMALGFVLTPAKFVVLALFVVAGSMGVLYLVGSL